MPVHGRKRRLGSHMLSSATMIHGGRLRGVICVAAFLWALSGCTPKPLKSELPRRSTPELVSARQAARQGQMAEAERLYQSVIAQAQDPVLRDIGLLELGQLYYDQDKCEEVEPLAIRASESLEPSIVVRARLLQGVCKFRQKDERNALIILTPIMREPLPREERQLLWDTALLSAEGQLDSIEAALALGALLESKPSSPVEERAKGLLRLSIEEQLPPEDVQRLYEEQPPNSTLWQLSAARLLRQAIDDADTATTGQLLERLRVAPPPDDREAWNALLNRADLFLRGNPFAVGVLLPLSGRGREVGDRLLRGIRIAAANDPAGPELLIRDTASESDEAVQATRGLLREHQVVAILGPVAGGTSRAVASVTTDARVPVITFSADPRVTDHGDHIFRFFFTPAEELRALVRVARARGLDRFVVLHPSHRYGQALRTRFETEVTKAGGALCSAVEYPPGTKSFSPYIQDLIAQGCRGVLIADVASRVALIAPTLAAEGAWAAPADVRPTQDKPLVTLLLPSLGWSETLGRTERRYLQGSLVARPYDPNAMGHENDRFRASYESQFGSLPDMFAAYGHDAYRILSFAIASGAATRSQLANDLLDLPLTRGLTAAGGFSKKRTPASAPAVFEFIQDSLVPAD